MVAPVGKNQFWLAAVAMALIILTSVYLSSGGVAGIERDPWTAVVITLFVGSVAGWSLWRNRGLFAKQSGGSQSVVETSRNEPIVGTRSVDLSELPYAVRRRGWELVGDAFRPALALVGGLIFGATQFSRSDGLSQVAWSALSIAIVVLASYQLWRLSDPWMVLYSDRLEARTMLGWRALSRSEIVGIRRPILNPTWIEIVPNDAEKAPVSMRVQLRDSDPVVGRWFAGFPDITAEKRNRDRAAVLADARYGSSEPSRARSLANARYVALAFALVCLVFAGWLYFNPKPYLLHLLVALAAPMVGAALVFAANGLLVWWPSTLARPNVLLAFAPVVGLAAGAQFNAAFRLLDMAPLFYASATLGLIVGVLLYSGWVWRGARAMAYGLGLAAAFAAYLLIPLADVALDLSPPHLVAATLQSKYVSNGRSTRYMLEITPWRDADVGTVQVSPEVYERLEVGREICVSNHPGSIGLGWYEVGACPGLRT